jgi:hypothetical protein
MRAFVYREPYGQATLNAEFERLRLAAIAGGKESHDAILAHLAAFKPQAPGGLKPEKRRFQAKPCGESRGSSKSGSRA